MSSQTPIEDRFTLVVKHQIAAISTMISNANDAKLTKVHPDDVDTILKLIEAMEKSGKQAQLVEMFISKSEYWDIIVKRDLKALEKNFPLMFDGLPVNKDSLAEPIRIYFACKDKISKRVPVVGEKNIEAMWTNLDKLVKASVIYDHENGSKFKVEYKLQPYYELHKSALK